MTPVLLACLLPAKACVGNDLKYYRAQVQQLMEKKQRLMIWIAPSEKDTDDSARIFSLSASEGERAGVRCSPSDAADQFRANSGLKSQEFSDGRLPGSVLGLIFLRFPEVRFAARRDEFRTECEVAGQINHR
ncbi:MAG: hypothetical protein HY043_07075 [Verrucomicrobia bacterium]|nr:hypothetical protein [Verrucomicrobiota bacterium]